MSNYKKPDLNAPRYRRKVDNTIDTDFYNLFISKYPEYKHLTLKEVKNILYTFNEHLYQSVINNRDGVEIPSQIGHLFIGTCPASKKRANNDHKLSLHYMQKVKHRNFESDQHLAKIFYTTYVNKYKFKNYDLWAFNSHRDFSRKVSAEYPDNWKKYVEVDPGMKISFVYKRFNYVLERKEENTQLLDEYNEFEL
jgi:hypothetical protein